MSQFVRIKCVEPRTAFIVHFVFTNGEERDIDLKQFLTGPIFEPLVRNRDEFLKMFVDPDGETIAWPNGADLDPDVLYLGLKPAWQEDRTTGQLDPAPLRHLDLTDPSSPSTTTS